MDDEALEIKLSMVIEGTKYGVRLLWDDNDPWEDAKLGSIIRETIQQHRRKLELPFAGMEK